VVAGEAKAALQRKARAVPKKVGAIVKQSPLSPAVARQVEEILDRASRELAELESALVPELTHRYFPVQGSPRRDVSAEEWADANARWEALLARGHSYRDEALQQVGPLLHREAAADLLGVSIPTLHARRKRGEVLGVSFDGRSYLYPAWQFVASPLNGSTGVPHLLPEILALLGDLPDWEKAYFLRTEQPLLGGCRPLDVLQSGPPAEIENVRKLARSPGEMGS